MNRKFVVAFSQVDKDDIPLVGGKGANLGEITNSKFPVPDGFIVTSEAYYDFLKKNNLTTKIKHLHSTINFQKDDSIQQVSTHIKKIILQSPISEELIQAIFASYRSLDGILTDALVAVRSSATAEDLPTASFAGQQDTFLNVKGEANLIHKIKEAWASLFNPRAMFYRHQNKFDHLKVGIAIVVQKMVNSEKSGVMFTLDPVTNDKSKVVIESIYGLGEYIVQGKVSPDHYEVDKKEMKITDKNIIQQKIMFKKVGTKNSEVKLSKYTGTKQKITDDQIISLANIGMRLEKHYYFPQDIEWAIEKNKIYIVQTRPVTTINQNSKIKDQKNEDTEHEEWKKGKLILKGDPASPGIASGPAKIIKNTREMNRMVQGDVLVTQQTNPDFISAMKKASAIVTDNGGRTSHAAIVSREIGIPAVVGTQNGTKIIKEGTIITVNGTKGEIYLGGFHKISGTRNISTVSENHIKTATKVYVNLAEPEFAENIAKRNVDGVGLLRAEFMMAEIGTHPKKLIRDGKKNLFTNKLADGIEAFCKAFYPRPVVYRTSDFKTNEYRQLAGGKDFEPHEENPMLGYRGAFRYMSDPEVFKLELEAIKTIREKKNLKNLWVMLPFVRTVKELINVKKIIAGAGLHRSSNFKLWIMVEIPANVILLDKFIETGIDGVSIGTNDLTQLILGTDRDNSEVAREFDEQNEAVLWALEHTIKTAHKYGITASICGQAASLYPGLVEKLVQWGVTSVSVTPDSIERTREIISDVERKIGK